MALVMSVNSQLKDLILKQEKKMKIITQKDKERVEVLNDAAHIMAMAVQELYPGTQLL